MPFTRARTRLVVIVMAIALTAVSCGGSAPTVDAAVEGAQTSAAPEAAVEASPTPTEQPAPTAEPQSTPTTAVPATPTASAAEAVATPAPPPASEPDPAPPPGQHECTLVQGPAPAGQVPINVQVVADGLEVPWGLALLPNGDMLVTERPGRLRLISDGAVVSEPVLVIDVSIPAPLFGVDALGSEGGLLGVLLHPEFASNRLFYLFHNAQKAGIEISRIDRFVLAADGRSADFERNILDDVPAGVHHQGGRMHIGPDAMLYVGVGAWVPELAQDPDNPTGKILRMDLDGDIPADNPDPDSRVFVSGIRNTQGFDWFDDDHLVVVDHGPSGFELDMPELRGFDEINIARAGENLAWPRAWGCDPVAGLVHPLLSFETSVPPTGATIYRGDLIPAWTNSLFMTAVGGGIGRSDGQHLHRVEFAPGDPYTVVSQEVYLDREFGRLRTIVEAPDGALYVMTSNCDNRGACPAQRDMILRITGG